MDFTGEVEKLLTDYMHSMQIARKDYELQIKPFKLEYKERAKVIKTRYREALIQATKE